MTSLAAKLVAKRLFKETSDNKHGQEDPYFETVPATRLGGMYKTTKKRRRALPPGLTPQEEKILTKAKRRAYRIDLSLGSFLGTRFGWGAVIGLVPGIGDILDLFLALMVYRTCCSVEPELPASVKLRMQINVVIDFAIGLVPFLGDIADAAYKCNTKNVVLLEKELRERGRKRVKGTPDANVADPSLPDEFDYHWQNEERLLNQQNGPPPTYTSAQRSGRTRGQREGVHDIERGEQAPPPMPPRTRAV
ncbi:hypothetical protein HRR83_006825 [Exophiala dermatitidis]|uniref:PH domain-containing protein n=1 Tax=Exophiala dermatitidis TaxID=5970 RepID=A0AAN6EQR4_EXODE|nr:hypothetical protein HRR75_005970 [Exophiala dermatitidis]KAJ4512309.1 hypothetical protein HRR73_005864 [Exophiala dermatitidis]KAJ4512813.1 hypothetical protein HRR74_006511 [Exophiala dermatitidis]KAJ4542624.1 hypothetical protein HRR77_005817 [Exophiala dermatitidis]KAJ4546463.1 hypothetical protein HRR78_005464 [Exophiala dermatitidis]